MSSYQIDTRKKYDDSYKKSVNNIRATNIFKNVTIFLDDWKQKTSL